MTISTSQILTYPKSTPTPKNLDNILDNESVKLLVGSHAQELEDLQATMAQIIAVKSQRISSLLLRNIANPLNQNALDSDICSDEQKQYLANRVVNQLSVYYWNKLFQVTHIEKLLINIGMDTKHYLIELVKGNTPFSEENIQQLFDDINQKLNIDLMVHDLERHQAHVIFLKNGSVDVSAIYQTSKHYGVGIDYVLKMWALTLIKSINPNWLEAVSEIDIDRLIKPNDLDIQFKDVPKNHCYTLKLTGDVAKQFRKLVPEAA